MTCLCAQMRVRARQVSEDERLGASGLDRVAICAGLGEAVSKAFAYQM